MPGVPTSRGCDACRRQKKKCDQKRPTCSRCARLQIFCTGSGQQRYKFLNKTMPAPVNSMPSSQVISIRSQRSAILISPTQNSSTCQLAAALAVSDPRFDLSIYGTFLKEIPRRIGSNSVLDAAASAMVVALPIVVRQTNSCHYDTVLRSTSCVTVPMLQHYGRALCALRNALSDPVAVNDPNTLCALYLVVIMQGWLQNEDGHVMTHGEGVCMILRSSKSHRPSPDTFEHNILSTLYFLVAMEGFINPRICLDWNLWRAPGHQSPVNATEDAFTLESLDNEFLARASRLVWTPETHVWQLINAYHRVRSDRLKVANLLATIPAPSCSNGRDTSPTFENNQFIQVRWLSAYAMLTLVAMRIGAVLKKIDMNSNNVEALLMIDLPGDFRAYVDDIINLAEQAFQYHPLGSSSIPMCLLAAYFSLDVTSSGADHRERIVRIFSAYRPGLDLEQKVREIASAFRPSDGGGSKIQREAVGRLSNKGPSAGPVQSDLCTIL